MGSDSRSALGRDRAWRSGRVIEPRKKNGKGDWDWDWDLRFLGGGGRGGRRRAAAAPVVSASALDGEGGCGWVGEGRRADSGMGNLDGLQWVMGG